MKKLLNSRLFLLALTTGVIILIYFSQFVLHANQYLLSAQGDGVKNYYTPAWYVKYDQGLHFTGMNYPFGEHVVFTDNQPMISGILNFIDDHLFPVSNNTIGILNLLIFISLFVSVLLIYKILIHYKLPGWFAFFTALLIGFGAPQLQRFSGHFALAYTVYFPLIWWLFIRMSRSGFRYIHVAIMIAIILFFNFIHIYYLFIALLFFGAYFLVYLFSKGKSRRETISLLLIVIVPVIIALLFMRITDKVSDRTQSPYGFYEYKATFQSVFLNARGNLIQWMNTELHTPKPSFEGNAYVGIIGLVVLLLSVFIFIKRWIGKKNIRPAFLHLPGNFSKIFIASLLVLMFSMALPFSMGFNFLLDILPFIKQFRSPGRLAWVFYYVFSVYGVIFIYLLYKVIGRRNQIAARLFIYTTLFFQGNWVINNLNIVSDMTHQTTMNNPFNGKDDFYSKQLADAAIQPEKYQAILFFPSFFQGSEKLYVDRTNGDYARALRISYQTGLPLINQMMSRTSISQTLSLASLTGHPAIKKTIPNKFNQKPVLIISSGKNLMKGDHYLIDNSKKLGSSGDLHFYELDLDLLSNETDLFTDYFAENKDSLRSFSSNQYLSIDSNSIFYRNQFEELSSPDAFLGEGSFYFDQTERIMIAEINVNTSVPIWIEISFWIKSYQTTTAFMPIKIDFLAEQDGFIHEYTISAKNSTDIIGEWVRGSENYEVNRDVKKIRIFCTGASKVNLDELVVRHTAFDVFYDVKNDSTFIYNNYPVGIPVGERGEN